MSIQPPWGTVPTIWFFAGDASGMVLRGALHTHSTCSDGRLTVSEVLARYAELGFDFVALTDHDTLLRPDGYSRALEGVRTDLVVFQGVELTHFEKGYVHVGRIQGDDEVLHVFNHPAQLDLPLPKAIERILAVAAALPLDAVEITSHGFATPQFDVPELPLVKVATDDSHTADGCGRAWVELSCRRAKDDILRAIKANDFWNCYASSRA